MLNVIIIEDEPHCVNRLKELLNPFFREINIVAEFDNIKDSIKGIFQFQPNLILMDVELKDGNCFDILEQINKSNYNFEIIFTTAHNEFAIKAFEYSAIHYLLKPIDDFKFYQAIKRTIDKIELQKTSRQIENIIHNISVHKFEDKKIAIPSTKGLVFHKIKEIIRFEADGNYSIVFLSNGKKCLATKKIKYYENLLSENYFFRTHQSHLVNVEYITQYFNNNNSFVQLSNNDEISVSVRRRAEFLSFLSKNKQL